MKISRWETVKKLKGEIASQIFMGCMMCIFLFVDIFYMDCYGEAFGARHKTECLYNIVFFSLALIIAIIVSFVDRGPVWDLIFWNLQETERVSMKHCRRGSGHEMMLQGKKPSKLKVYGKVVDIPEAEYVKFYYLKWSKVVVAIEAEGIKQQEVDSGQQAYDTGLPVNIPNIPQYSRKEIRHILRKHHIRPLYLLFLELVGIVGIIGMVLFYLYARYSKRGWHYWHMMNRDLFFRVFVFIMILMVVILILYLWLFRGYVTDMCTGQICATELLPVKNVVYCKNYARIHKDAAWAEIRIKREQYKRSFLIYKNVSKYWDCFPGESAVYDQRDSCSGKGKYQFDAVRFYYLRNSKLVVKVEVVGEVLKHEE